MTPTPLLFWLFFLPGALFALTIVVTLTTEFTQYVGNVLVEAIEKRPRIQPVQIPTPLQAQSLDGSSVAIPSVRYP